MPSRYAQWMHEWETRLTSVDNNRVVRRMEWGAEWARDWPCRNGYAPGHVPDDSEKFLREYNRRIIAGSDEFYSYAMPTDFRLERREVRVKVGSCGSLIIRSSDTPRVWSARSNSNPFPSSPRTPSTATR